MRFVEFALNRLRESGERVTPNRRRILAVLAEVERPLSPYDLETLFRSRGEEFLAVSIYRALKPLERLGLVHRLRFAGGYLACRLLETGGCHHHLICRACGCVAEVSCPGLGREECWIAASSGFRVDSHLAEFVGVCRRCQAAQADAAASGLVWGQRQARKGGVAESA